MVEFFQNIFKWFVIYKDTILLILAAIGFVSLIVLIVFVVKQLRATKLGNTIISNLSEPLSFVDKLVGDVKTVSNSSNLSLSNLNTLETKMDDSLDAIDAKLNAILDVQSIVYSGIKDETARKNVANLLTSARLVATSTKTELLKQLEELKSTVAKIHESETTVAEVVNETVDKVKKVTTSKKSNVSRY